MKLPGTYLVLVLVACSGGERRTHQPPLRIDLIEEPRGRAVVAEVDGRPIYEDCVARQLSRSASMTREAALDQCIDFELLARHAERFGHAASAEVYEARRTEAVRAFIDEAFSARFDGPEDVPETDLRRAWKVARSKYDHPEYRFTVYVRAPLGKAPAAGQSQAEWQARDRAARALAEQIHARLAGERGLEPERFFRIAREVAGDRPLSHDPRPFNFPRRGRAVPAFADAAFSIPAPGMVSRPTRTRWGWDVILLLSILPEVHKSFEQARAELAAEIFEASRQLAFLAWSAKLGAGHRIYPDRNDPDEMADVEHKLRALASDAPSLPGTRRAGPEGAPR